MYCFLFIVFVNRVVFLEDGWVVEDGIYEDLILRRDGKFRKMVDG